MSAYDDEAVSEAPAHTAIEFRPEWLPNPETSPYEVKISDNVLTGDILVGLKVRSLAAFLPPIPREDAERNPELVEAGTAALTDYVKRTIIERLGLEGEVLRRAHHKLAASAKTITDEGDRKAVLLFLSEHLRADS